MGVRPLSRLPALLISTLPLGRLAVWVRVHYAASPLSQVGTMMLERLAY